MRGSIRNLKKKDHPQNRKKQQQQQRNKNSIKNRESQNRQNI